MDDQKVDNKEKLDEMNLPYFGQIDQTSQNKKIHEIGFLVALLLFLIIQFVFFYFGLPELTNALKKEAVTAPNTIISDRLV